MAIRLAAELIGYMTVLSWALGLAWLLCSLASR